MNGWFNADTMSCTRCGNVWSLADNPSPRHQESVDD